MIHLSLGRCEPSLFYLTNNSEVYNMKGINELENVLLDQIEKLNDDSIGADKEEVEKIIGRSKAISDLATNYINIQQLKVSAILAVEKTGGVPAYEKYLGITEK